MWRSRSLPLFWFLYFGALGVYYPYFSLYLREDIGLRGTEVGVVVAVAPLVGIVAQPLWGQISDRTGARTRLLAILTFAVALGYLGLRQAVSFPSILCAMALLSLVGTAVFPILTSVTLAVTAGAGPRAFGRVRAAGTVGYLAVVVAFPWFLEALPSSLRGGSNGGASRPGLGSMFLVMAGLLCAAAVTALALPRSGAVSLRSAPGEWRELLRNRPFRRLLVFSLAAQLLMHGPLWLFPIFVRQRGGDVGTIRAMWILMLLVELPLVLHAGRGLQRVGARGLLGLGALIGGVRWAASALVSDPWLLFAVQALHGVAVLGLDVGSPLYLDRATPERLRSTAQGLLSVVAGGIAAVLSSLAAGWLMDRGSVREIYLLFGGGAVVLGVLSTRILPDVEAPSSSEGAAADPHLPCPQRA